MVCVVLHRVWTRSTRDMEPVAESSVTLVPQIGVYPIHLIRSATRAGPELDHSRLGHRRMGQGRIGHGGMGHGAGRIVPGFRHIVPDPHR
jgi:hypothetical protein